MSRVVFAAIKVDDDVDIFDLNEELTAFAISTPDDPCIVYETVEALAEDFPPPGPAEAAELLASALGQQGLAWNGGGHLTCSEADAVARALVLLGQRQAAEEVIQGHASEDEEGDRHFPDEDGPGVTDEATAKAYVDTL